MDTSLTYHERFEAVFATLYGPLCQYALTYIKKPEICEDIVQEVFARVWEKRKDLLLSDSIRFYLFTAVRNNCISHLRKEKTAGDVGLNGLETEHYPVVLPMEGLGPGDQHRLLAEAINELPGKCREIFVLSRLSNMKYKEIADALGISIKTVENQLGKALKMMRRFLQKKGIETYSSSRE